MSSKTTKARAATAAAVKEKKQTTASSVGCRSSTRKRSCVNQDDGASVDRPRKKRAVMIQSRNNSLLRIVKKSKKEL